MPRTLTLAAVQPKLAELVAGMVSGEEVVLTTAGEPVAVVTRPRERLGRANPAPRTAAHS